MFALFPNLCHVNASHNKITTFNFADLKDGMTIDFSNTDLQEIIKPGFFFETPEDCTINVRLAKLSVEQALLLQELLKNVTTWQNIKITAGSWRQILKKTMMSGCFTVVSMPFIFMVIAYFGKNMSPYESFASTVAVEYDDILFNPFGSYYRSF